MESSHRERRITQILFVFYLLALTWIILLKMQFDFSSLKNMHIRNINLIPFGDSLTVNGRISISEILLNIIAFIPFGVYLSMINCKWRFFQRVLPIFGVSLGYEVLQYIFAIGGSDITDLIGNTLGGIIGIVLFWILHKILGRKTIKILNILAVIGTVCVVLILSLLFIAN